MNQNQHKKKLPRPQIAALEDELTPELTTIDVAIEKGKIRRARKHVKNVIGKRDSIERTNWAHSTVLAKAAHFAFADDLKRAIVNYNAYLIEKSVEFNYVVWPRRIQKFIQGKNILDVGCGFGAFGNGFLIAGANSYCGVDPGMKLDSSFVKNKRKRERADLGMTPNEIMDSCPDIRLVNSTFENLAMSDLFDVIVLHNVTEHLLQIKAVFSGLKKFMAAGSKLIFHHHNFYCWNGHHLAPNRPEQYDQSDPKHKMYVDWNHILIAKDMPPDHYFNRGLNQIRLKKLREVVDRDYVVDVWEEKDPSDDVLKRLTPQRLSTLQRFDPSLTRQDLLVNAVLCVASPKI